MRSFLDGHWLLWSSALLLTAGGVACDDGATGIPPTGLEVQVYTAPQAADPFEGVSLIRLVMDGDGLDGTYSQIMPYTAGGSAVLDGVPFSVVGQSRGLTVEGWAAGDGGSPSELLSRGRATPVEVLEGKPPTSVDVLMARVNHFQDMVNVDTLSIQRLINGRLGHTVTATAVGEIVVAGGGVVEAPGAAWWTSDGFERLVKDVESIDRHTSQAGARGELLEARAYHTAVPLSSGQIIMAGGFVSSGAPTKSIELYNPVGVLDGTAKPLQPMAVPRAGHTATLINETTRTILFVGGDEEGTWELWDPVDGSQGTRPLPDGFKRQFHTATRFFIAGRPEPAVLIAGGESDTELHATAMLYDSVAQNLVPVNQPMPNGARTALTATLVAPRGFIYIAGGFTDLERTTASSGIDVFDIATQTFVAGNEGFRMRTARGGHTAVLLPNNTVLIAGGVGSEPAGEIARPLSSIEVIHEFLDVGTGSIEIKVASSFNTDAPMVVVPYMPTDRVGAEAIALDNGMALLVGGAALNPASGGFTMVPNLTLYNPL